MLQKFQGEDVVFKEKLQVKTGVVCDCYDFKNNQDKDLGVVFVEAGSKTPLQKVLRGDRTIEGYMSGKAVLRVDDREYYFPNTEMKEVEVQIGEMMQWEAEEDLIFYEVCYPPYEDGRYQDLD